MIQQTLKTLVGFSRFQTIKRTTCKHDLSRKTIVKPSRNMPRNYDTTQIYCKTLAKQPKQTMTQRWSKKTNYEAKAKTDRNIQSHKKSKQSNKTKQSKHKKENKPIPHFGLWQTDSQRIISGFQFQCSEQPSIYKQLNNKPIKLLETYKNDLETL